MEKVIVCFSGTGNSYYVACKLKEKLNFDKVLLMPNVIKDPSLYGNPKEVGIIFPTYNFKPVSLLSTFVKEVMANPVLDKCENLFIITTCGLMPGKTLNITERLLGFNNYYVTYSNVVKMIDSYTPLGAIPSQDKIDKKYAAVDKKIETIAANIKSNKVKLPLFKLGVKGALLRYIKFSDNKIKAPFIVTDACTGCGICVQACPTGAIELIDGKATFKEGCTSCWGCYHRCPEHAIKYSKIKKPTYYKNEKADFNPKYKGIN